jgi:23S rRNA-/tRNA-specific pseudouridylate synthase
LSWLATFLAPPGGGISHGAVFRPPRFEEGMMPEERVQKIVARSGRCSRREAERMIREGRVTVNGHVIELGATVDPQHDHIKPILRINKQK